MITDALKEVSAILGVNTDSLTKLINFESGFNPAARNPFSGARGLIQFMPATARNMGFRDADEIVEKYPDAEKQLRGPVLKYLSSFKPFPTNQSLYMSVFYPAYRSSPVDTPFSENIRKQNPGINFVSDYINLVEKKTSKIIQLPKYSFFAFLIPVSAVTLTALYLTHRKDADSWLQNQLKRIRK
jgi:hypothetical protein